MVRDSLDVCIYKHLPIVYCLIYWDVLVLSFCFFASMQVGKPTSVWDFWETNHALHVSPVGIIRG